MKKSFAALTLCLAAFSHAEDNSNFSIGLGTDHAGVAGIKYSFNHGKSKYYGSLALLGYSSLAGSELGYGIGWERLIARNKHSLGLFAGTVSMNTSQNEAAVYYGLAGTYNYYFSGYDKQSFVLGGSAYVGTTSSDERLFDENSNGIHMKVAYQW